MRQGRPQGCNRATAEGSAAGYVVRVHPGYSMGCSEGHDEGCSWGCSEGRNEGAARGAEGTVAVLDMIMLN